MRTLQSPHPRQTGWQLPRDRPRCTSVLAMVSRLLLLLVVDLLAAAKLASAARSRYELVLSDWIQPRQQGFLPGRSLLANLLDVETASMITSLNTEAGACMLMDFASAFPSKSQEFMMIVLKHIGVPQGAMNFINALYNNSFCRVRHGNCTVDGFRLEAGVRQG